MRAERRTGGRSRSARKTAGGTGSGVSGSVILATSCRDELLPSRAPHRDGGNAPPVPPSEQINFTTRCGILLSADNWPPARGWSKQKWPSVSG
jgi:hypothetical protein